MPSPGGFQGTTARVSREDPLPLYHQLREILLREIQQLKPGDQIPSEPILAHRYRVSKGTVKQAIQELVRDGLLYRVQGKGTFVTLPKVRFPLHVPSRKLRSFTEDLLERGLKPETRVLSLRRVSPPDSVAEKLQNPEKVWVLHRLRLGDGVPIAVAKTWLREDVCPDLEAGDIGVSLYETLLRKYGIRPARAKDVFHAWVADATVAPMLEIPVGSPLFRTERVSWLDDGRPLEYVVTFIRGDRYEVSIDLVQE